MTFEVLHSPTAFGWSFRCPVLAGVEGGARTYAGSCEAAEHAIRYHLGAARPPGLSIDELRALVRHTREDVAQTAAGGRRALPRGRHRLSRAQVEDSQRARLLDAVLAEVAAQGYDATTIGAVVQRAGVSRETFYRLFDGKNECFQAAADAHATRIGKALLVILADGASSRQIYAAALRAYLSMLARDPDITRALLLERPRRGPDERSVEPVMRRRAAALLRPVELAGDPAIADTFSAMLWQVIEDRVAAGDAARLSELAEPVLRLLETLRSSRLRD